MQITNHNYSEKELNYFDQSRHDVFQELPPTINSLLDVGCSNGAFADLVRRKLGIPADGIEPFPEAAELAINNVRRLYKGTFDEVYGKLEDKYDCITFNDVLEHIDDVWNVLIKTKSLLTSNGFIVASIPNIQCYSIIREIIINQDFRYKKSGILDKTHLRFFTRKSIIRLFENNGYNIIKIKGIADISRGSRLLRFLLFFLGSRLSGFKYQAYIVTAQRNDR